MLLQLGNIKSPVLDFLALVVRMFWTFFFKYKSVKLSVTKTLVISWKKKIHIVQSLISQLIYKSTDRKLDNRYFKLFNKQKCQQSTDSGL